MVKLSYKPDLVSEKSEASMEHEREKEEEEDVGVVKRLVAMRFFKGLPQPYLVFELDIHTNVHTYIHIMKYALKKITSCT